jgi:SAM-dependent methyltransferase
MEQLNNFIDNDEFSGIELYCNRHMIAQFYLSGNGIEIGALHKPLQVSPNRCHVQYVDYKTYDQNRARYPELANETIVNTDIIDDGFVLETVPDNSQDFIIANHALEHSPDPYGTLTNWMTKLRPGGVIYAAIPIADKCYDKGRPVTSLQHLVDDHDFFSSTDKNAILDVTKDHIWEFICISDKNIRESMGLEPATRERQIEMCNNLMSGLMKEFQTAKSYAELINAHVQYINKLYDIHYHTFTPRSYETFLRYFTDQTQSVLENVIKNGSGECIGIIRK